MKRLRFENSTPSGTGRGSGNRRVGAPRARRVNPLRRLGVRLTLGVLVVALLMMTGLAGLLLAKSTASLTSAAERKAEATARSVTLRVEDWTIERRHDLLLTAGSVSGTEPSSATASRLGGIDQSGANFLVIQVTDLVGRVLMSSKPNVAFNPSGRDWFKSAASGRSVKTSPVVRDGHVEWVLAEPIMSADGTPEGTVIGYLNIHALEKLLNPALGEGTEVVAVDSNRKLLYASSMGELNSDTALLTSGVLADTVDNVGVTKGLTGATGVTRYTDRQGAAVIAGYDHVDDFKWVVLVQEDRNATLAPVVDQRHRAQQLIVIGALIAIVFALAFAAWITRPVKRLIAAARQAAAGHLGVRVEPRGSIELEVLAAAQNAMLENCERLVNQLTTAGLEVNSAATELSASSDELAATTTQQSAAVTEASATTEELARASSAIADTVEEVAAQTTETRNNLEQARSDIQFSSEHTVALAGRVHEIGGLLNLINELADQTNLLALNAAIEAARAGEEGRGFAVVAEEVRRLAERSKRSARDIAVIVEGVREETNSTVMAMEKGAKQMQAGLLLLERVTDAANQVRLTTQQQRSATSQVVDTMEQLTDASRQVSATARQIAVAAGSLADLAGNLENTAGVHRVEDPDRDLELLEAELLGAG